MEAGNQLKAVTHPRVTVVCLNLGFIAALICLADGFLSLKPIDYPTRMEDSWRVAWAIGLLASVVTLIGLRFAYRRNQRVLGSLTLCASMAGCWLPLIGYFNANHTYFWPVIAGLGLVVIVGASLCRLQFIPLSASLFLGLWFWGAVMSPRTSLPIVKESDGIRCVFKSPREFDIQDLEGRDISRVIDEWSVGAKASIGWLIQTTTTPRRQFTLANAIEHRGDPSFVAMSPEIQKPSWSRSMNLQIEVQRWPKVAACELKIPVNPCPTDSLTTSAGEYDLSASHFQGGDSHERSLTFNLMYSRTHRGSALMAVGDGEPEHYRLSGKEFGIVDDRGNRVPALNLGPPIQPYYAGYDVEVAPLLRLDSISPKAKWIKIQVFTAEELAKNKSVFEFDRIP